MPIMKTEFSCPSCKQARGVAVQVMASNGELTCPNGHRWADTMAFMSLKPIMEFKVKMEVLPQPNHEPLTVSIPISLKKHLTETYGDRLAPTLTAVLMQLSDNSMIISDGDLDRLRERFGKRPDNSSELIGLIYAKVCEADDAKLERDNALMDLKAYEKMAPGRVVVDLSDQYTTAQELARNAEKPLKVWVEDSMKAAIENGWF